MRDLAEVNAISNMITLTPTVQMTTGDINSGADLDTIMSRINRTLEEQFVSSAEGCICSMSDYGFSELQ